MPTKDLGVMLMSNLLLRVKCIDTVCNEAEVLAVVLDEAEEEDVVCCPPHADEDVGEDVDMDVDVGMDMVRIMMLILQISKALGMNLTTLCTLDIVRFCPIDPL